MKKIIKLLTTQRRWLCAIALVAVIALSMAACAIDEDDGGGGGGGGGYWLLISSGINNPDGTINSSGGPRNWIAYSYKNDTNYEEEYTTESYNSFSIYHYTRTGQTSTSTTETFSRNSNSYSRVQTQSFSSGTSSTTSTYDEKSGLTINYTTVSSGSSSSTIQCNFETGVVTKSTASSPSATTGIIYAVELLSDTGGVRTYKHTPVGNTGYNIYKIQGGRTTEVSYYDANNILMYTTTYTQPEDKIIRERLPRFTVSSTNYYSSSYSINSQYQTAKVGSYGDDTMDIVITTFTDGVGSSTFEKYEKINFKKREFDVSGDYRYQERNGKITITGFTNNKIVSANIPAQIDGKPVTAVGYGVFRNWWSLSNVTIPDSVTSLIGTIINSDGSGSKGGYDASETGFAFSGCDRLTSVTIGSGIKEIGADAFSGCWNLTNVTLPNSVTGIGREAFRECVSLTNVTLPNSVTRIEGGAFFECVSLTGVTIPNSVTSIGNSAFSACRNLTNITLPNSVTDIGSGAFGGCPKLTSVTFQGEIHPDYFGGWYSGGLSSPFAGDLRERYLEGGKGTYTTTAPVSESPVWTKSE